MRLLRQDGSRRVVVTGFGAVTSIGDVQQTWSAVMNGQSGICKITRVELNHVPVKIGGQVETFETSVYFSRKDQRRMPLVSQFAVIAAMRAREDAGLSSEELDDAGVRAGTVIGTTMGPHLLAEEMTSAYRQNGHQRPNPIEFANCLPNMPAHYVSRMIGLRGPLHTPVAACATGTQALGLAMDLIRYRRADIVFAGATEAILKDYIFAGFASLGALAEGYEAQPTRASRPFDADRSGFVLSEGSGVLVLESLEHALRRGASVRAEVVGYASTSDAYHIAAIDPNAFGMQQAMTLALADANIDATSVSHINAHGTGTPANDALETLALHKVFGQHAPKLNISSSKGAMGHSMAAAGAIEAIITLNAMETGVIPPTMNLENPDPDCDLDYTPLHAREAKDDIHYAMSNNFGLGGQNASVIFGKV